MPQFGSISATADKAVGDQQAAVSSLTDNTGGSADGTLVDVGLLFNQTNINNNFADVANRINAILTALKNNGLMST
jgi:hypothetical protein